jgi:hypothetical protein
MGKSYDEITPELSNWIGRQRVFFVATAPLASGGLINCSPKGLDTLRILGPREVAYLDLTGSGIETLAHSRENGRIVFMFCAFEGPPKIVRLHGTSQVLPLLRRSGCDAAYTGGCRFEFVACAFDGVLKMRMQSDECHEDDRPPREFPR